MSKLLDHIKEITELQAFTGRKILLPYPFNSLEPIGEITPSELAPNERFEYKIGFQWFTRMHCKPEDFEAAKKIAMSECSEAIYSDFWRLINKIDRATIKGDAKEIREVISEMRDLCMP